MLVDMPEGPVIHATFFQIFQGARRICRIPAAYLGMEHADGKSVASSAVEFPGQIVPLFALGITLPVNGRYFFAIYDQGDPFDSIGRKHVDIRRKGNLRLPRFERVVIPQDGKDLDVILC